MALIIAIQNISALADVSDYRYKVMVGDGTAARSTTIAHGKVFGHTRADGWVKLVQQVLAAHETRPVDAL
jgi:hypothetical protein